MASPLRSPNIGFPIRVFIDIPSSDTLDAINAFINDTNKYLSAVVSGGAAVSGTVAILTPLLTTEGASGFATNGRKIGEGPAAGTGVPVYFSAGSLRVESTDAPVLT
jgi:hypothetical protein